MFINYLQKELLINLSDGATGIWLIPTRNFQQLEWMKFRERKLEIKDKELMLIVQKNEVYFSYLNMPLT